MAILNADIVTLFKLPFHFFIIPLCLSSTGHAVTTIVYLINRLSTPTINNESPFLKLFGTVPNYNKLRCFGCLCYPSLHPYTSHKLESRSMPCLFVGYSSTQSAYLCLDTSNNRLYTSRHVRFVESVFPFADSHHNLPCVAPSTTSEWCSMTLPVTHSVSSSHPSPIMIPPNTLPSSPSLPPTPTPEQAITTSSLQPLYFLILLKALSVAPSITSTNQSRNSTSIPNFTVPLLNPPPLLKL